MPRPKLGAALAAVACLVLGAHRPGAAQALSQALAAVDSLVEQRAFAQARAVLASLDTLCRSGAAGAECRARVEHGGGYLAHRQAREAPEPGALLEEATRRYLAALREDPGWPDALHNLALVLGETDPARLDTAMLKQVRRMDPARAGLYDRLRGDHALAAGREAAAVELYFRALNGSGPGEAALARLVDLNGEGLVPARRLLAELGRAATGQPGLAAEGYLAVAAAAAGRDRETELAALVEWARTRAAAGTLDSAAVAEVPEQVDREAVQELAALVRSCAATVDWWSTSRREEVPALLALDIGRKQVAAGNVKAAFDCWAARFRTASGAPAYEIARELADLIRRYPDLDEDSSAFRWIEDRIFDDKAGAIRTDNLEVQERAHATLGLVYADRGQWGDGRAARGAVVQLERALAVAARRDAAAKVVRPLPDLWARLAEGYRAIGRTSKADSAFMHAAESYLDLDALDEARRMLANVAPAALAGRAAGVNRYLESRMRVPARELDGLVVGAERSCGTDLVGRGSGPDSPATDAPAPTEWTGDPFVARQRFKLLADCAAVSSGRLRRAYAAEALRMVVSRPGGGLLAGASDYERLERVAGIVSEATAVDRLEPRIAAESPPASRDSVTVAIGSETAPVYVVLPRDAVLTARALRVFATLGVNNPFYVDGDAVVVTGEIPDAVLRQARDRLRALTRSATMVRLESPGDRDARS